MRNKILLSIALVAVFFVGGSALQAPKQQWEYKIKNGVSEKKFNDLGAQGWELTSCASFNGGMPYCVFKHAK
jgi:PBP1b-binding outer membrane lipoprotein LpoB